MSDHKDKKSSGHEETHKKHETHKGHDTKKESKHDTHHEKHHDDKSKGTENSSNKHAHHTAHKKKKTAFYKKTGFYQFLSLLFAVGLVASIMTNGFSGINNADVAEELDTILNNIESSSTEQVKSSLSELKNRITGNAVEKEGPSGTYDGEPVELDFYVMSQCPYGTEVMDAIAPVLDEMGEYIDFEANYIVNENADGTFSSLHGEPEVQGNIVQLCAAKYEPEKYMDMIVCMDQNMQAIPGNWESCAKQSGLDVEAIKTCYEGDEGKDLLSESALKAQQAQASGSPTIFLEGEPYQQGRTSADFKRAICSHLDGVEECDNIPKCSSDMDCPQKEGMVAECVNPGEKDAKCDYKEPVKMEAIILSDERCGDDCEQISNELSVVLKEQFFTGVEYEMIDYSDGGKKLMDKLDIELLPTIIFGKNLEKSFAWKNGGAQFQSAFKKVDDYYYIIPEAMGSFFDPESEVCDNGVDDTGNDLVDCEDPDCSSKMICREEEEQNLKVFVMSECPYGTRALDAMDEVLQNFGEDMDFDIHYIATETSPGEFEALHGQSEVDENIRQLCVAEYEEDKLMDYIWCRNDDLKGDWKNCAEKTDVDVETIESCFTGQEGKDLLSEDIKIANELGIGASPTWLANNNHKFSGVDAETIKTNYCKVNPDLDGCDATLSTDTQGAPSDGSC